MLGCDLIPQPVSEIRVEEDAWMEAVATLDHLTWLSVVQVHSFEHVLGWEVVICDIEVTVLLLFDDFLVFKRKILSEFGRVLPCCCVGVEPACTRTDFQAIEEVVNLIVAHVEGMSGAVKVFEEQVTISQTKDDNMTSLGQFSVQPIEQLYNVLLEIFRFGASDTASADIIANQLKEKNHRMIRGLITMQGLDVSPTIP